MDFNATIDLIIKDLDDAHKIIDDLKKYPGVPLFQVEFAKAKCKSACEVIALLKNMPNNVPVNGETIVEKPKIQEHEEKVKIIPTEKHKHEAENVIIPPSPDDEKKQVDADADRSPTLIEKKEAAKKPKADRESAIYADRFSHLSNNFNEQLSSQKGEDDVSEIIKNKPLSNLPDAIGVNDKFLFVREIFDGNTEAYDKAIVQLDKSESIADARAVITSFTDISYDNKVVKQLLDLVKRKLLSNE